MQETAWQMDFFGEALPMKLKSFPKKLSLEAICNSIGKTCESASATVPEVVTATYPKQVFGLNVEEPSNIFERLLAERVKATFSKANAVASVESVVSEDEDLQALNTEDADEEAGGGIIGAHKKLLKLSLEDLRKATSQELPEICRWIMDGNDQARYFSFDACCRVSEIDPDSLREYLVDAGYIPHRFLH